MSTKRLIGLESIAIGSVGAGGLWGSTLTTISNIVPDSATFVIDNPGTNKIYCEDKDYPDMITPNQFEPYIEFATRDMDPANLALAFGGTGSGTHFMAPYTALDLRERSVYAIGKTANGTQVAVKVTRGALTASADLKFAKTDTGSFGFRIDVMQPSTVTFPWDVTNI